MKKLKKILSIIIITALLFAYVLPSARIFAEDPGIVEETQTEIDNSAVVENTLTLDSNTGDNSIGEITPTPTVTDLTTENTALETPEVELPQDQTELQEENNISIENSGDVANDIESLSISGENLIEATESGALEVKDNKECGSTTDNKIETGDAVSETKTENSVNVTEINSEVIHKTINIYFGSEDVDLSTSLPDIGAILTEKPDDSVINVLATNINNFVYLSNDIQSSANTGNYHFFSF